MRGRTVVLDPVRLVVFQQGRRLTWVAAQLGISTNHLHRLLLPADHPDSRTPPEWFYPRLAQLLGVPESMLRPDRATPKSPTLPAWAGATTPVA